MLHFEVKHVTYGYFRFHIESQPVGEPPASGNGMRKCVYGCRGQALETKPKQFWHPAHRTPQNSMDISECYGLLGWGGGYSPIRGKRRGRGTGSLVLPTTPSSPPLFLPSPSLFYHLFLLSSSLLPLLFPFVFVFRKKVRSLLETV